MQQKRIGTTNLEKLVAEFSYCSYLIWDIWKYMYIFLHERTWTNMYAYVCMYMCACACKFNNKIHKEKWKQHLPQVFLRVSAVEFQTDLTLL